jgi:arylsulfatase A-like enzyme
MMELDYDVGQILKKLDDLGIADNTIVVFTTDNGAEKFTWPDGGTEPFRGEKGTTWEGGIPRALPWLAGPASSSPAPSSTTSPRTRIGCLRSSPRPACRTSRSKLLNGYKAGDKTFKVHLDAYDMTELLSGKGPGQRKEIFYFDDSGSLNAFRYGDWKITFATKDSWWADVAKPRTVPLVVNLRQDPFEVTPDSGMYTRWYADKLWVMIPAQAIVGQFLQSFKEFPPATEIRILQRPANHGSNAPTIRLTRC